MSLPLLALLLHLGGSLLAVSEVGQAEALPKLDTRIPKANHQQYSAIRDGKDWRNPFLVVLRDGLEVRAAGYHAVVPVTDLRGVLVSLPRTAWPYGRVVAAQEASIRNAGRVDDASIRENIKEIAALMKTLDVVVDYWAQ